MKKISSHTIFSIFDDIEYSNQPTSQTSDEILAFSKLISGVENYYMLDHIYNARYGQSYEQMRQSLQVKYFITLLKSVDSYSEIHSDTVIAINDKFGKQAITFALNELLDCFLQVELYNECATVAKLMQSFNVKNLQQAD